MPYAVTAVDTTENRKNFNAPSALRASSRRRPTRTNAGSETASSAIRRLRRSREADSTSIPLTDQSSSAWNSPGGIRPSTTPATEMSRTTTSTERNSSWKNIANSSATYEHPSGRQNVRRLGPPATHAAAPSAVKAPTIDRTKATVRRAAGGTKRSATSTTTPADATITGGEIAA